MAEENAEMLGYKEIAELLGVSEGTLRNYRKRGYMPEPDVMLADRPRWLRVTIDKWRRQRDVGANERREP